MPPTTQKPYWIDEQLGKHEAYFYGESDGRVVSLEIQGRSLSLIMPDYIREFEVRAASIAGDLLFIIAE